MNTAFENLAGQITAKNSRIILGLDPSAPEQLTFTYLKDLIQQCAPYIVGIKPNLAFYSYKHEHLLQDICNYALQKHPELLRILDSKRGDIANTQSAYANADITNFNPDIITVNGYMGEKSAIEPYLSGHRCVFALTSTSNPDTSIQNMRAADGMLIYQHMALAVRRENSERVGYVVGATKPESAKNIRDAETQASQTEGWVLAPGFGKQNGDLSFVNFAGTRAVYPISRGISESKNPAETAKLWRDIINKQLTR
jgi:orotidine 5'-phosphate decarboxylase subfamily 2